MKHVSEYTKEIIDKLKKEKEKSDEHRKEVAAKGMADIRAAMKK